MLNENVVKLLKSGMWDLATCANGEPNVVPVAFKDVTPDGKLVVGDVFLDTTLKNLAANGGKIAISVYDAKSLEGYQIKGMAEYVTEGEVVKTFKAMVEQMFNGAATAKFIPMQLDEADPSDPTDILNTTPQRTQPSVVKQIVNGKLLIKRGGKVYNANGQEVIHNS